MIASISTLSGKYRIFEFEYNKLINNLPLYDVKIDFENSFNDKTLTEGRSINNAFEDLGVILNAEPSFLTISSVLIPEVSGKYSATNSNPLYEGTINGRFIDSKSKRKLGVNKLAFSLGLINQIVLTSLYMILITRISVIY